MQYRDLRDFIRGLEQRGELKRISAPVSPVLEMTEICDRTLQRGGPALHEQERGRLQQGLQRGERARQRRRGRPGTQRPR